MKKLKGLPCFLAAVMIALTFNVYGQKTNSHAKMHSTTTKNKTWVETIDKALTDSGHVNKRFKLIEFTLAPGHNDIYLCFRRFF